ncbi:MAG: outer membrane protein assembly factor BamE [Muribaculaceae bacterium]|nr:outer membrane protein assembly factor BamE [Muribaculaceae bacterium]
MFCLLILTLMAPMLSSCFTGVEGTKKISLSKDDRKAILPSDEELFFRTVSGEALEKWEHKRPFIAADNKTLLIFEQQGLPTDPETAAVAGKTFLFEGVESRMTLDGGQDAVLVFSSGNDIFRYNTGKSVDEAPKNVKSDEIPMMIDLKMIESARKLLVGKKLWTRSPLWYDGNGNRIPGKKYVPVTISDVRPGSLVFPIKVRFADENGNDVWAFMNFGNSGKESRSFSNIFYLSDIRKKFPAIEDDVWQLICSSKVRTGMTKDECRLALGNPQEVDSGHDYTQTLDLWHYSDGAVLWFEDGILTRFRK